MPCLPGGWRRCCPATPHGAAPGLSALTCWPQRCAGADPTALQVPEQRCAGPQKFPSNPSHLCLTTTWPACPQHPHGCPTLLAKGHAPQPGQIGALGQILQSLMYRSRGALDLKDFHRTPACQGRSAIWPICLPTTRVNKTESIVNRKTCKPFSLEHIARILLQSKIFLAISLIRINATCVWAAMWLAKSGR